MRKLIYILICLLIPTYLYASTYTLTHFRGYDDDGVPGSATPKAATDSDWSQNVDENFRIRFSVLENTSFPSQIEQQFYIQYSLNEGDWVDLKYSNDDYVRPSLTSYYTHDESDNNQRISSGDFDGGRLSENLLIGSLYSIQFSADGTWEFEWCLTFVGDNLNNDDVIQLRLVNSTLTGNFTLYNETASVTVVKSGAPYEGPLINMQLTNGKIGP